MSSQTYKCWTGDPAAPPCRRWAAIQAPAVAPLLAACLPACLPAFLLDPLESWILTVYCVTGVDFGTLKTVIAVARNRGVDVVRTSHIPRAPLESPSPPENRQTPQRQLGTHANARGSHAPYALHCFFTGKFDHSGRQEENKRDHFYEYQAWR